MNSRNFFSDSLTDYAKEKDAYEQLQTLASIVNAEYEVNCEMAVLKGKAGPEISEACARLNIDVLVMGRRNRSFLQRYGRYFDDYI